METTATHELSDFVQRLHGRLDDLVHVGAWSMAPAEVREVLPAVTRARARLAELELRLLAQAERVDATAAKGADLAAWWAVETAQTRSVARRARRLAAALDARHEPVQDAMALGRVLPEQAEVIVDAVDALPKDLIDPEVRRDAEAYLIKAAAEHDAKGLRILGRRVLEVVAPEVGEEHERRLLEREEREASARVRFTMRQDGHGSWHGRFRLPDLQGAMLNKTLMALAAPARAHLHDDLPTPAPAEAGGDGEGVGVGEPVSRPLRMGEAFCEYVERFPVEALPQAGGVAATIVVEVAYDSLLDGLRAASLDTGDRISAQTARRLACGAGIVPMVLGGASQPLDVGRERRFHTKAQRLAMAKRDRGCTAQGCDWPPAMCHAHHDIAWSKGGRTSVKDGRLLCPPHHGLAHDDRYTMEHHRNGKVSFHRRT